MNALWTALYARLAGGTALTALLAGGTASIHHAHLPHRASFPAVVYGWQGGGDQQEYPRRRIDGRVLVKAVSMVSLQQAGQIDAQIDPLLHRIPLTVAGWTNTWLMREGERIEYAEHTATGQTYYHVGGIYRVRLAQ